MSCHWCEAGSHVSRNRAGRRQHTVVVECGDPDSPERCGHCRAGKHQSRLRAELKAIEKRRAHLLEILGDAVGGDAAE